MFDRLKEILIYGAEGFTVDFKREQYPIEKHEKKHELIKDISSMANHPSEEDKYIIIGVKEKDGVPSDFFSIEENEFIDDAKYQEYVNSNIEPKINFEYKPFEYKGYKLAYFRIFDNQNRPYLIKRDVKNSMDKRKIEYHKGEGFIRQSTSTKKLTREDFDIIYDKKYRKRDRKNDLKVTPYKGVPKDDDLSNLGLQYIDLSIENLSNQSIFLDLELKVYKGKNFSLFSEEEFRKELAKQKGKNSGSFVVNTPAIELPNFHINFKSYDNYVYLSLTKMRFEKTALDLSQKSVEKDVFGQYLLLFEEKPNIIELEVVIRSDDFTEGIWKKKFKLDNKDK